jgi:hypothetical protein
VGVFSGFGFDFWFVDISYKGMDGREEERLVYTKLLGKIHLRFEQGS